MNDQPVSPVNIPDWTPDQHEVKPGPTYKDLLHMANRRRIALTDVGCSTYILGTKPGQPNILCVCCGMLSYNENDIKNKFCAFCYEHHAEWK